MDSVENKDSLYEYKYAKDERLGFTREQDLEVLYSLYPQARNIKVTYSIVGEAHFVISNS